MKGYRTIIANVIAALIVLAAIKLGIPISGDIQTGAIVSILGAINISMRCITDTPMGSDRSRDYYDPSKNHKPYG